MKSLTFATEYRKKEMCVCVWVGVGLIKMKSWKNLMDTHIGKYAKYSKASTKLSSRNKKDNEYREESRVFWGTYLCY